MPCQDDYPSHTVEYRDKPETKKRLDLVTRLLCALCKKLENTGYPNYIAAVEKGELATWWKTHKKIDAAREAREVKQKAAKAKKEQEERRKKETRKNALAKLTADERRALGIT